MKKLSGDAMGNNILHSFTTIKEGMGLVIAAFATCVTSLVGISGFEMDFLMSLMAIDYVSGLIVAGVFKKSPKSKDGKLESRAGLKGLFIKGGMLCVIYIAANIDILFKTDHVAIYSVYFFIGNEILSFLENLGLMGVKYPPIIKNAIGALSKKGESTK